LRKKFSIAYLRRLTVQHCSVTRLLLDAGAKINVQGGRYSNALQATWFSDVSFQEVTFEYALKQYRTIFRYSRTGCRPHSP
jgi:hypothetical protein